MGLLGKILKTGIDMVTIPADVVKDVITLGGEVNDEESAIKKKFERLGKDVEEIRDEADKL